MKIAVSGATGLVGSALVSHLRSAGHEIIRLVRSAPVENDVRWDPAKGELNSAQLEGVEGIVHLAGVGIGDHRWSDDHKKAVLDSRVQGTQLLAQTIASLDNKPKVFLSASAIGIYGDRGNAVMNENSEPGEGFLADVCRQWEASTQAAEAAGVRTVHLRTGVVQSDQGGQLAKQLPFFKVGAGGRLGSGKQWISWISLDDEVRAIEFLLASTLSGAVNLVAPNPVTNHDYTRILAAILHRPALLPTPLIGPKLLFGEEMVREMILSSARVDPTRLIDAGFVFNDVDLEGTLRRILHR